MNNRLLQIPVFAICLLLPALCAAAGFSAFRARDGMANFAAKARAGGEVRVAYLGGSITAEQGWRTLSFEYLARQFPAARFVEIFAAAPGTGSDFGACRVENDVLRHEPDLLFVEFAVNDETTPDDKVVRTMEAIVRKAWKARPKMDICFVYTLSFRGLPDLEAGSCTRTVRAMERVAGYYGIPSVHMGANVARRIADGEFMFGTKDTAVTGTAAGKKMFTRDSVHPTPDGHAVYMETLANALQVFFATGKAGRAHLPGGLLEKENAWENATIVPVESLTRIGKWKKLATDDPRVIAQAGRSAFSVWEGIGKGAALEFTTRGHVLGLAGISTPDSGQFSVTVDDRAPVFISFFDRFTRADFVRASAWFYPEPLDGGPHRVRIELTGAPLDKAAIRGAPLEDAAAYEGLGLYLSGVLVLKK